MGFGSLARSWGFGVEFEFLESGALATMSKVQTALHGLREGLDQISGGGSQIMGGLGGLATIAAPFVGALGLALGYASSLSAEFDDQALTFDTILGDQAKSRDLMKDLVDFAAKTPFEQSEIMSAGKDLLITADKNTEKTKSLVRLAGTLAAVNHRSLAEATNAVVRATQGEMDPLKSFAMVGMGVERFKKAGAVGGAAFKDAVIKEITKQTTEMVSGKDMMELLSGTQSGSLSNVKDAFDQMLKGFGDEMKPLRMEIQTELIEAFTDMKEPAVAAFHEVLGAITETVSPWVEELKGEVKDAWGSLGPDGQKMLFEVAMAVGVATVAFGTLAAGVVAVGTVVGSFGMIAGGIVTVIGGIATVAGALGWEVLIPLGLLAVATATAIAGAFAIIGTDGAAGMLGEAWEELARIGGGIWEFLSAGISAFYATWEDQMGGIGDEIGDELRPSLEELWGAVMDLLGAFGAGGFTAKDFAREGSLLAYVFSDLVVPGIELAIVVLEGTIDRVAGLIRMFSLGILWARSFVTAIVGIQTGTLSLGEAFELVADRSAQVFGGMLSNLTEMVLTSVDNVLGGLIGVASKIPGAGFLVEGLEDARSGLKGIGKGINADISNHMLEFDSRANAIEQRRRDREQEPIAVAVKAGDVAVSVEVDGNQIAKTVGKKAVDDGATGKGPKVTPDQRGRVLRNGLQIQPLAATEVL